MIHVYQLMRSISFLSRLSQLGQARQLGDVVRYNLFPSADMVLSMSKKYGTRAELWEQKSSAATDVNMPLPTVRIKRQAPLDSHNREYLKQLSLKQCKDFIQVCT